jgi:DNA-binding response OmpR family regulator
MTRPRILVVDDEQPIVDVVEYALREDGFDVAAALDGDRGWKAFEGQAFDLVILDLNLPGIPGLELFGKMRALRPATPVIMLTVRADEAARVSGLEIGADDYVTKPFSPRELAARVRAVLRRVRPAPGGGAPPARLRVGPVEMEPESYRVTYHGAPLALSRQEFVLLECLLRHPGRIFSRDALIRAIYDGEAFVTDRSVDAQVKRLRRKFQAVRARVDPVQTVYGLGYKLNQELETRP